MRKSLETHTIELGWIRAGWDGFEVLRSSLEQIDESLSELELLWADWSLFEKFQTNWNRFK